MPEAPRITLVGVRAHVRPVAGDAAAVRLTVPVNPPTEATVIVEVATVPATAFTEVGLAVIVKSTITTLNVTVAERDNPLLVPVTVTLYVP